MKVAVFSTKSYDKEHFNQANSQYGFELEFFHSVPGPMPLTNLVQEMA